MVSLLHELLQRPLLQLVVVLEILDGEVLEALLCVDGAPDEVKHRVDDICG